MSTLVIAEHNHQSLHSNTLHTLTAAQELGEDIVVLVVGHACQAVAEEAARLVGVQKVLVVDNEVYAHFLAESFAKLVQTLAADYQFVLFPASTFGKNIAPRVAALLDVAQVSEVSKIIDKDQFEHPIYAGNAIETVRLFDEKKVLTIRSTAFEKAATGASACSIERIDSQTAPSQSTFLKHELSVSTRPDLSSAKIIVSGGRGLQSAEKFKLVEELADSLGAAVGASRAAVDAGFVPNDYQVGQTGKVVAPTLYIALGISGAVQHLAGMKDSKVIVAINKDEEAPIFQIADYALVGDLFELVPQLINKLKK